MTAAVIGMVNLETVNIKISNRENLGIVSVHISALTTACTKSNFLISSIAAASAEIIIAGYPSLEIPSSTYCIPFIASTRFLCSGDMS